MNLLVVLTIVSVGLVTGLLFAFSNFVMKGLDQVSDDTAAEVMRLINKTIINPLFLLTFLGSTACAGVVLWMAFN